MTPLLWLKTYRGVVRCLVPFEVAPRALSAQVRAVATEAGCAAPQPAKWWRGDVLPPLPTWKALVVAAGRESEWGALSDAWQAERARRRQCKARGKLLTRADVLATWALPAKEAAGKLGVTRQAVEAARKRWPYQEVGDDRS